MHILVAPNAFKNSLNAGEMAEAICEGLEQSALSFTCSRFPIGDGGDGTGELIMNKCGGVLVNQEVSDPLGRKIQSAFGLIDAGKTAVIEMADASGLRLLKLEELDPLRAQCFGTGEQMKIALDKGVKRIVIGMGGSATVDGGTGILRALGIQFLDGNGKPIQPLPGGLEGLAHVDISGLDPRIRETEVVVLCDVDNLLLGDAGAAAMFGPQKGATASQVGQLDAALRRFSEVTLSETGIDIAAVKYGGTAGGAAAGLFGFLGARLANGIDYFLELTGFSKELERSNLLITGEGSIDEQTLKGKAPFGVAKKAAELGIPVIALAGRLPLQDLPVLHKHFHIIMPIGNEPTTLQVALQNTRENVVRTARTIGDLLVMRVEAVRMQTS